MLEEITWEQFQEWATFASLSPFSGEREDYRFASVVQAIVNMNRDPKKKPTPYPIDEFLLHFGDTPKARKPQSAEQQKAIARQLFMAYNGMNKKSS